MNTDNRTTMRQIVDDTFGLAVSLYTLAAEMPDEHPDRMTLAKDLLTEADPHSAAQATVFLCTLLSRHTTGLEVRAEADSIIERVVANGLP